MDPKHPNLIIAASNINNYYLSVDTGRTWTNHKLVSTNGVWGDPAIAVDTAGTFYFFHLSNPQTGNWIDRIVCQKTVDAGMNWNDGSFTGLNGTKAQDKHWPVIDPVTNNIYVTWTQFDEYGSSDPADSSIILFSKSVDNGESWSNPVRISKNAGDCIDSDGTVEGAVPAVGPDGQLYVVWAGPLGLVFNRSLDDGATWLPEEKQIDPMPGGWDYRVSGIYRSNGLPVTLCDLSPGPNRGTIYVNWTDQRNGANDTDVWLIKSKDGGDTWSAPIRVNDDNSHRQQFFTYMAIDQTNGDLHFIFYDRRDHMNDDTDVYLALSRDGGETFLNRRISETPFRPEDNIFFGDYTNITVNNGIIRPIWTRLQNGSLSIWTHLTTTDELITSADHPQENPDQYAFENFPNPAGHYFYVSYKLHTMSKVSISILDDHGRLIRKILKREKQGYGKYIERINLDSENLPSGLYYVKLDIDGEVKTMKQMIVN